VRRLSRLALASELLANRRRTFLTCAWLTILVVGLVDHVTGTDVGLGPFYLVPITLAAWYLGTSAGLQLAAGAAAVGFMADVAAFRASQVFIPIWNAGARVATFVFVAWMVGQMRAAFDRISRVAHAEQRTAQRLREADETRNTFVRAVSHDLRTPLAAIIWLAEALAGGMPWIDEEEAKRFLDRIAANAKALDGLVVDLLEFDRLNHAAKEISLTQCDLGELVADVVRHDEFLVDRRVHLTVEPLPGRFDPTLVERIMKNLITNVARYTPSDTDVWIRAEHDAGGVLLVVEDAGPGVPLEMREVIFEPFRQGTLIPGGSSGLGIGLWLVANFAQMHGGRAWVQDRPGGGASFRVHLPSRASAGVSGRVLDAVATN